MKKTLESEEDAITAFAKGKILSKRARMRLMKKDFKGAGIMSFKKACWVLFKHIRGKIHETRENLPKLAIAWLRLGEKMWQKIITATRYSDWVSISSHELGLLLTRLIARFNLRTAW